MLVKFIVNSVLLGVALAMDAFSVSCANGLNEPHMKHSKMACIAGTYAFFQFLMPMTGWFCVHAIASYFNAFRKFIPWIALVLLLFIGVQMLCEGIKGCDDEKIIRLTPHALLLQGIATSIDALSVGFTIANYELNLAVAASLIIAAVTFCICISGLYIGRKAGMLLAGKASILGGIILIAIGIEIFIS
ncbi:manganese efflux pump MntP family protein [Lachnospiraceae bacterium C1.1]|nr:manganese efflux pump [Lachnospiraceae bacterium C1.1]